MEGSLKWLSQTRRPSPFFPVISLRERGDGQVPAPNKRLERKGAALPCHVERALGRS